MWELIFKEHFDASHLLSWHQGKCKKLHGHRWDVEIRIKAESLNDNDIIVDFGDLKKLLPDHESLNSGTFLIGLIEIFPEHKAILKSMSDRLGNLFENPTAERLAEWLYRKVCELVPGSEVEITVWEGEGRGVKYNESD